MWPGLDCGRYRLPNDAILDRRPICRFPWTLVALIALAGLLPARLRDRLLRRIGAPKRAEAKSPKDGSWPEGR